jgi:AcrR family transcriptional regulator
MQRRRLLVAMGELLAEDGIEGATVGAICKRASVSRRTFYESFEDREECFLAVFDQAIEQIAGVVGRAYGGGGKWNTRVRAGVTTLLEYFDVHPDVARVCVIETLRGGPALLEHRRQVLAVLTSTVDQGGTEAKHGSGPLPLTAEGVVGGALAVVHGRLLARRSTSAETSARDGPLVELANALTAMIVHPYLGSGPARSELERPVVKATDTIAAGTRDPFKDLAIRITYRTALVLATIAGNPGASNRAVAEIADIGDDGQMSRLLRRLEGAGLVENIGEGHTRGEPNAWRLTERGAAVHATLAGANPTTG